MEHETRRMIESHYNEQPSEPTYTYREYLEKFSSVPKEDNRSPAEIGRDMGKEIVERLKEDRQRPSAPVSQDDVAEVDRVWSMLRNGTIIRPSWHGEQVQAFIAAWPRIKAALAQPTYVAPASHRNAELESALEKLGQAVMACQQNYEVIQQLLENKHAEPTGKADCKTGRRGDVAGQAIGEHDADGIHQGEAGGRTGGAKDGGADDERGQGTPEENIVGVPVELCEPIIRVIGRRAGRWSVDDQKGCHVFMKAVEAARRGDNPYSKEIDELRERQRRMTETINDCSQEIERLTKERDGLHGQCQHWEAIAQRLASVTADRDRMKESSNKAYSRLAILESILCNDSEETADWPADDIHWNGLARELRAKAEAGQQLTERLREEDAENTEMFKALEWCLDKFGDQICESPDCPPVFVESGGDDMRVDSKNAGRALLDELADLKAKLESSELDIAAKEQFCIRRNGDAHRALEREGKAREILRVLVERIADFCPKRLSDRSSLLLGRIRSAAIEASNLLAEGDQNA